LTPGEEVVHHPDDRGPFGVGDPVKDFVDLVRMFDLDGNRVRTLQSVDLVTRSFYLLRGILLEREGLLNKVICFVKKEITFAVSKAADGLMDR
jgi:hypothetical protein